MSHTVLDELFETADDEDVAIGVEVALIAGVIPVFPRVSKRFVTEKTLKPTKNSTTPARNRTFQRKGIDER